MQQQMTYRRLLLFLQEVDEEQLNCQLTLEDSEEEYYPAILTINTTDDLRGARHQYFCISNLVRSDQHASK